MLYSIGELVAAWNINSTQLWIAAAVIAGIFLLFISILITKWGAYWLQAYVTGADVSMASLIAMTFMRLDLKTVVAAKIMGRQAGLPIDRLSGMSTERLQAHLLAGGDVKSVVKAIIVAQRANIQLDFDRAAAIDLAGRDVLYAVQTSVSPRVIHCPADDASGRTALSAVAKNGIELLVSVRVTVRTNLDQLIGGATEDTIIARVGQAIVSAIGSAESHMDVLEIPSQISKGAMARGLDQDTAFAIVSIDISQMDVGENIGARLQSDQAESDIRIAQANAESHRAEATATWQENIAAVALSQANYILAEAEVPASMAIAFRAGNIKSILRNSVAGQRLNLPGHNDNFRDSKVSAKGDSSRQSPTNSAIPKPKI